MNDIAVDLKCQEGYAFRRPGHAEWIVLIPKLIVVERESCPFLACEVAALTNVRPVIVLVNGPSRYKEVLETGRVAYALTWRGAEEDVINARSNRVEEFGISKQLQTRPPLRELGE